MKKLFLSSIFAIITIFGIYGQCENKLDLNTPSSWAATSSPAVTTITTNFYGHTNWVQLNKPSGNTAYQYNRVFWVCKSGKYQIQGKGMGNNDMTLSIDGSTVLFTKNITDAKDFNTPPAFNKTVELKCGRHTLNVSIADDSDGNAGFYVDATILGLNNGCLSNKECKCQDNVCQIPDEKCNPDFSVSLSPDGKNGPNSPLIEANPMIVGSGTEHYWGVVYAKDINDISPISIKTIISGKTWGSMVDINGKCSSVGIDGTNIACGKSGYGYTYGGFPTNSCFKITHYIKCCNKWYSKTKTFCTKAFCTEQKESEMTETSVIKD